MLWIFAIVLAWVTTLIYMCGILRNCKFCDSLGRKYMMHSTKAYGLTDRLKNTVDRQTEVRIQVLTESP